MQVCQGAVHILHVNLFFFLFLGFLLIFLYRPAFLSRLRVAKAVWR